MSYEKPEIQERFSEMQAAVGPPIEDPGYLQYWQEIAQHDPDEQRVANMVKTLAVEGVRKAMSAESAGKYRSPSERARYWYRTLGPLNPLEDSLPDMVKAAEMTYGFEHRDRGLAMGVKLDNAYMLSEIARLSDDKVVKAHAITLAFNQLDRIQSGTEWEGTHSSHVVDESYKTNALLLGIDLRHLSARTQYEFDLERANREEPTVARKLRVEANKKYDRSFAAIEVAAIAQVAELAQAGHFDDETIGALFEWSFIANERYALWSDERIDTVSVRSATSREDAEWRGETNENHGRHLSPNHDVIIEDTDGRTRRIQLKTRASSRQYDPSIEVLDFADVVSGKKVNFDQAAKEMLSGLQRISQEYRMTLAS